jgi:hypothetical protein
MKYAVYNPGTGAITGLYDDKINLSIPTDKISITNNQWLNIVNNPGTYQVNTGTLALEQKSGADLLAIAKTSKKLSLNQSYTLNLFNGFTSSALGSPQTYKNTVEMQSLLNSLIAAGATSTFYYETGGELVSASHTLAELEQVLDDLIADRLSITNNLITKYAAVDAALTIPDVEAITW